MIKCLDCGELFDEPKRVMESRGEFWGMPAYEPMYYCPYCDSDEIVDEEELENEEDEEELE